jgi:hypothetical protein
VSRFGIGDLELAAVEVGYIMTVAVLTKALLAVAKRVGRFRTARGMRQLWNAVEQPQQTPEESGYRTNVARSVELTAVSRSKWLSRRRAERAARYVQKLEDEATMKS